MTQQPPRRPPPPPVPNLAGYRPAQERQGTPATYVNGQPWFEPQFDAGQGNSPNPRQAGQTTQHHPYSGHGAARQPGTGRPPVRRKRSWLRIAAWTVGSLGVLTAAGIAALVTFAPVGIIREQVVREVKVRTGRDLVVAGRTSLSVFPSLALTMGNVSLSAPPGMGGGPFVQMRRLDVRVPLMPLLSRKVEVEQLVLSEPIFELRVDQRGRRSWEFAELSAAPTIMVAQAPPRQGGAQSIPPELQEFLRNSSQGGDAVPADNRAPDAGPRQRRQPVQDIVLGDVRIDNGTVRYRDDRTGLSEEVRAINARLSAKSLSSPIEAKGDLALRGDKIDFEGRIGSPKALLEERPSRVSLSLGSPRASGRFQGTMSTNRHTTQVEGNLEIDTGSLRGLAQWGGAYLAPGAGLGPMSLTAELRAGPTWVSLNNAKGRVDDITGTGNITVEIAGGRPLVKGSLQLGAVDLNHYLGQGNAPATSGSSTSGIAPAAPAGQSGGRPSGAQVKGFEKRTGWSEAPIDLSALGLLDAEIRLAIAGLVYRDIKVGSTQVGLGLKNRVLRTSLDDMRLYGGQGRGVVTLEPTGQTAAVAVNMTFDGVTALPLLTDATGFDWIDGKGRIQLTVGGNGANERAIMESLSGKAEFGFTDGALIGFNLPQMIRGISQGKISGFSRLPTERTDFSEAGASFQIRNGVAETKDLRATSPLLRLTGTGTADLGQRQIDAMLRPKVVGSLSGQGAAGDLAGLELPVRIRGPWERPQIGPDIDGLLKNPGQAVEAIREIGKQLQQGKGGAAVNQLLDRFLKR